MAGETNKFLKGLPEIAQYLGVSEKTVQRWRDNHNLPVKKVGTAFVTTSNMIDQWISGGKKPVFLKTAVEDILDMLIICGIQGLFEKDEDGKLVMQLKEGVSFNINHLIAMLRLKNDVGTGGVKPQKVIDAEYESVDLFGDENPFIPKKLLGDTNAD
jgi:excisionase family DNA binding protein